MADQIQIRRGTASNWTSVNPVLAQGEEGYEEDTGNLKFGDGATAWNSLVYFGTASSVPSKNPAFPVYMPAPSGDITGVQDTAAYAALQTLVANGPARIFFGVAPASAPYYMNATPTVSNWLYTGQLLIGAGEETTYISPGSSTTSNTLFASNTPSPNTDFNHLVHGTAAGGPTGIGMCDMTIEAGINQVGVYVPNMQPGQASVTQAGTPGSTTRFYKFEYEGPTSAGRISFSNSIPSIIVSTTSAATLNGTNYDILTLPTAPTGAVGVRVSMSTSGGTGNYVVVYQASYVTTINVQSNTGLGFSVVPQFVNGTGGVVVGFYAQQVLLVNFRIRNALGMGLWTEWAAAGTNDGHDTNQMESTILNVKIMDCGATNWFFNGAHDSNLAQVVCAFGSQSDSYEYNMAFGPSADGSSVAASHFWGGKRTIVAVFGNGVRFDSNCQFEDGTVEQIWVMAQTVTIYGEVYNVGGNSSNGIHLGHTVSGVTVISASVLASVWGSALGGAAFAIDADAGHSRLEMINNGSTSSFTGTPASTTDIIMPAFGILRLGTTTTVSGQALEVATQAPLDSSTKVASTAYVDNAVVASTGYPLATPQAGQLSGTVTLVASTLTTLFTLTLAVGTWKISWGAVVVSAASPAAPTINTALGTAIGSVAGKSSDQAQTSTAGGLFHSLHVDGCLVTVTTGGTVLLEIVSNTADVVQFQTTSGTFGGATGYEADRVA